jgi:hypothetical protein
MAAVEHDQDDRLMFSILTIYLLISAVLPMLRNLHIFDPLPITRRRIFVVLSLYTVAIFSAGYGLGRLGVVHLQNNPEQIYFNLQQSTQAHAVLVPIEQFEIAWSGEAPPIIAPWGETHQPKEIPIQPGLPTVMYKPYTTPPSASIDFVAWQIHRAMNAVYGRALSPDEIKTRYLEVDETGRVRPQGEALTLRSDDPSLSPRTTLAVFPVLMLLICFPYLLLTGLVLRLMSNRYTLAQRKAIAWYVMGAALVLMLGFVGMAIAGLVDPWALWSSLKIGLRHLQQGVPGGGIELWVVCAGLLWVAYRVAEKAFARHEAPPRAVQTGISLLLES